MSKSKEDAVRVFKRVKDPDIGQDIWTLGFIQGMSINGDGIYVVMSPTCPGCHLVSEMVESLKEELKKEGFVNPEVELKTDNVLGDEETRIMMGLR